MVSAMENARRRSPAVLARLADHAFFRGDIARSLALAQAARDAYAHAQDADAHAAAEASFLVGRAYHAQGMLDAA